MNEHLCIILKYIKQMLLVIQVGMDKSTIVVADCDTHILVLDRKK